ncbi:MAG: FkbM family methyltransferase, partial [Acidobacteriota bacterium]|nr:FkbM family methyltransferase [Acidobacteriota bacterium]
MSRLGAPNRVIADRAVPISVKVIALDSYCESTGTLPDVLLIDIEGFEIAALAGAARVIRKRGNDLAIVVEMHPAAWDSADTTRAQAESLLVSLRLRAVPLTGQTDPLGEYGQVQLVPLD